eukprot:COSAG04_NODE_3746_length_2561_cov_4.391552_2_plen_134_part_00
MQENPLSERRPDLSLAEAGCPAALVALVERGWADEPKERPTLEQLVEGLHDILSDLAPPAPAPAPAPAPEPEPEPVFEPEPEPELEPEPEPEPAVDPQTAAVAQFIAVSGCDEATARRFLARAEWNLQRALDR